MRPNAKLHAITLLALTACSLPLACGSAAPERSDRSTLGISNGSVADPNTLMNNVDLTGGQSVSAAAIQAFLHSKGSGLAGYSQNGESAAAIIQSESVASGINPVYMLARIETESGLVESSSLANLASATGCACPDTGGCNPADSGFFVQVQCAAQAMHGYLTSLSSSGVTVSGWRIGSTKDTLDPCAVTPTNAATAALYTYTPWVGAYSSASCGDSRWGGSSLVAIKYFQYAPVFGSTTNPCAHVPQSGNGVYCGSSTEDGFASGSPTELYTCLNGAVAGTSSCPAGCNVAPAGQADTCRADPCAKVPASGNGGYCGRSTEDGFGGGQPLDMYDCQNERTASMTACRFGCYVAPAGQADGCNPDPCAHVPASGNGAYCGSSKQDGFGGGASSTLYDCQNGQTASTQVCKSSCVVAPSGQSDHC